MRFYTVRAEFCQARELAKQLMRLVACEPDPVLGLAASIAMGMTSFALGECAAAYEHAAQGLARYEAEQHRDQLAQYGEDMGVLCLCVTALLQWLLGYAHQALQSAQQALRLAQDLGTPFDVAQAQFTVTILYRQGRELQKVHTQAEALVALTIAYELPFWRVAGTMCQGWVLAAQGQEDAIAQITQGLAAWQAIGADMWRPYFLAVLTEAYTHVGQTERGLGVFAEALDTVEHTGGCCWEAEFHRLKGELLLACPMPQPAEAEACFQQALSVSRHQQAKSLELRAATGLARLWQSQGKREEARALLGDVYGWFTEGFDTTDLQDAKALLEDLGE